MIIGRMKKRFWVLLFSAFWVCLKYPALSHADPVAPVYIPNTPKAEALIAPEDIDGDIALPTVTVRGFLNFRTTVDGTVIVFTPASESPQEPTLASVPPIPHTTAAKLPSIPREESTPEDSIQHLSFTTRHDESKKDETRTELENETNSAEEAKPAFRHLKQGLDSLNNLNNHRSSADFKEPDKTSHISTPTLPQYPTGLVTVLGGTRVDGGATTVYETKVIGTYIEGKYAQILQSTSHIIFSASASTTPRAATPKPSPTRTASPITPTPSITETKSTSTRLELSTSRFRPSQVPTSKETRENSSTRRADRRKDEPLNANTVLQSSFKLPEGSPDRLTRPTQSLEKSYSRSSYTQTRRFRPTPSTEIHEDENTVPEAQGNRRQPPRFRYVLPRRNTPTVRLNRFKVKLTVRNDGGVSEHLTTLNDAGDDSEEDLLRDYDPLNPVDPAHVVYEKTTITSEVTLHVGRRKSVRTLTITTSVPKTRYVSVYLSDAINDAQDNALFATSLLEGENIPQVVVTRTYTTTERMLKTSVVPILDGESTSFHTVTESFFILKLITGYKTLPPGEMTGSDEYSSSTLDPEVSSLLDGVITLAPHSHQQILPTAVANGLLQVSGSGREQAVVPRDHTGSLPLDFSNPLMSLGAALQQNPLAAVYLGLQQLNRQATLYSTITKTSSYVATDTVYNTKVVSFYDGRRTRSRTLSESISTTERTVTTYSTTVEPYLNTQMFQQHPLQQLIGNQLPLGAGPQLPLAPKPQFSTVTSTYTTVTTATSLSTRIYTLIYNAISTKFRTVTSSTLYETTVTATTTSEVPIALTAPPGGVFPFLG